MTPNRLVDRDVAAFGVAPSNFGWMAALAPSAADIAFATSLKMPVTEGLINQVTRFLGVFAPTPGRIFVIGLVQWMKTGLPRTQAELTYLVLAFEAVFRVVVQVLGLPCLNASTSGDELRFQYLMLDEAGLNSPAVLDNLVSVVPSDAGKANAKRCLQIATQTRNAGVHGALGAATAATIDALSRAIILSVDLLIARALHHMIGEAAYLLWESDVRAGRQMGAVETWHRAQTNVLADLDRDSSSRRRVPVLGMAI